MEKIYKFVWGWDVYIITSLILLLIISTCIFAIVEQGIGFVLPIMIILLLVVVISWIRHPKYIIVDQNNIIIKMVKGAVVIPVSQIKDISSVKIHMVRFIGNNGLFGYRGIFMSRKGRVRMYATERKHLVMIETLNNKKIVVSCRQADDFVAYVKSCIIK